MMRLRLYLNLEINVQQPTISTTRVWVVFGGVVGVRGWLWEDRNAFKFGFKLVGVSTWWQQMTHEMRAWLSVSQYGYYYNHSPPRTPYSVWEKLDQMVAPVLSQVQW